MWKLKPASGLTLAEDDGLLLALAVPLATLQANADAFSLQELLVECARVGVVADIVEAVVSVDHADDIPPLEGLDESGLDQLVEAFNHAVSTVVPYRNRLLEHYAKLFASVAPPRKVGGRESVESVDVVRNDWRPWGEHTPLVAYLADGNRTVGNTIFNTWTLQDLFEAVIFKKNKELNDAYTLELQIWAATAPHCAKAQKPPQPPKLL